MSDHACNVPGCDGSARLYPAGWRCIKHSPAGHPLSQPDPDKTLTALRARAGRQGSSPLTGNQVHDDRAIASGKRRASPHEIADARRRLGITPPPKPETRPFEPAPAGLFEIGAADE